MEKTSSHFGSQRPAFTLDLAPADLRNYYWLKSELVEFCRQHGIPATGKKLEILERIERCLQTRRSEGPQAATDSVKHQRSKGPRDSDQPLTLQTPVVHFRSDKKTREFFISVIGPHFHFTAHWGDFMRDKEHITYGDLAEEWIAEKERRKDRTYKPEIMKSCEYNQFIRDFFADEANQGKKLQAAIAAWNEVKAQRGPRKYGP